MKALRLLCVVCVLVQIAACRQAVRSESVVSLLNAADTYLTAGNTKDALELLSRISTGSCSVYERIGVFRRLHNLGETDAAAECLERGIDEHPENDELAAVYAWFLLRSGRLEDAEAAGGRLLHSPFAAVYTEIYLRNQGQTETAFTDESLIPLYLGAYQGSRDERWLRNAAVTAALAGDMASAVELHPGELSDAESALFWAYCAYDSRNFITALDDLAIARMFCDAALSDETAGGDQGADMRAINAYALALTADIYQLTHEEALAESIRETMRGEYEPGDIPASFYYNTIRYQLQQGSYAAAYENLDTLLTYYPDYAPALALYGRFAMEQERLFDMDDEFDTALRTAGLSSLRMDKLAEYPRIRVEDAVLRMEEAYERTGTAELLVESLQLTETYNAYRAAKNEAPALEAVNIWELLERNTQADGSVSAPLVRYAAAALAKEDEISDAQRIFDRHLLRRYGSAAYMDILFMMESWECEFAAYFFVENNQARNALRIYEYLLYEIDESYQGFTTITAYEPSSETLMNLAALYAASGNGYQALELYRSASAKTGAPVLKAECLYRMALLQIDQHNLKEAIEGLSYCVSLDPSHNRARLLLERIEVQQ